MDLGLTKFAFLIWRRDAIVSVSSWQYSTAKHIGGSLTNEPKVELTTRRLEGGLAESKVSTAIESMTLDEVDTSRPILLRE